MAKAYYSTVFEQPAPEVWKIIRDFNNYPVWANGAGESRIEDGKSGDTVGAIRNVFYQGRRIRQRLLAQSDVERSQTYEFCGAASLPLTDFQATLRITPVVDGDRAFVEWSATFDCDPLWRRTDRNPAGLVREMARIVAQDAGRPAFQFPAGRRGSPGLATIYEPFWAHFSAIPLISGYPADSGSRTGCCIREPHLA
jgi:hypothetical protein